MGWLPGWWYRLRDAFWAGPDYLSGGRPRRYLFFTVADAMWAYGLARRKFTLPAILAMPVVGIILLYALIVLHSPMMPLVFLLLGIGTAAPAVGWFFRLRGELVRTTPVRVRAGETAVFSYEIRSARYIRVYDVVCDPFRWAPHLELVSRGEFACLPPRTVSVCEAKVRALRRGVVQLYRPIAESSFPFGLVKWSIRGKQGGELLIWPAFTPLEDLRLPRGAADKSVGSTASALPGESPDLLGSRDFRTGDAIRHIDWPGSARRGALVVKEFAREEYLRIAVVADTCPPRPLAADAESPELEAAMSLAAAVADNLLRHGTEVDVLAAGRRIHRIRPGRQGSGFEQVCDILAAVRPEKGFPSAQLADALIPELHETAATVLLLLADTPERRDFAGRIARNGVPLKVILLAETPPPAGTFPRDWRHVRPSEVFAGGVSRL